MTHYAEHLRHDALAKIDVDKCKHEGGFIDGRGMYGIPRCVHPYPDAGKACTDTSQCTGMCKAKNAAIIGTHDASGTCQIDSDDRYGCYDEIKSGVVVGGMCFD